MPSWPVRLVTSGWWCSRRISILMRLTGTACSYQIQLDSETAQVMRGGSVPWMSQSRICACANTQARTRRRGLRASWRTGAPSRCCGRARMRLQALRRGIPHHACQGAMQLPAPAPTGAAAASSPSLLWSSWQPHWTPLLLRRRQWRRRQAAMDSRMTANAVLRRTWQVMADQDSAWTGTCILTTTAGVT
jgi:hypothetical protein